MIVNLHGFNSAGNNNGFAQLSKYFEPGVRVISPSYTVHNFVKGCAEIIEFLSENEAFHEVSSPVFLGSSTGALYAEALAGKFDGKVVLINPVVDRVQLKPLIGPHKNYATEVEYDFTLEDWNTFDAVEVDLSLPRLVFIENGDERLDHSLTRDYYRGHAKMFASDGDSHRYSHWADALPKIGTHFFAEKAAGR